MYFSINLLTVHFVLSITSRSDDGGTELKVNGKYCKEG